MPPQVDVITYFFGTNDVNFQKVGEMGPAVQAAIPELARYCNTLVIILPYMKDPSDQYTQMQQIVRDAATGAGAVLVDLATLMGKIKPHDLGLYPTDKKDDLHPM